MWSIGTHQAMRLVPRMPVWDSYKRLAWLPFPLHSSPICIDLIIENLASVDRRILGPIPNTTRPYSSDLELGIMQILRPPPGSIAASADQIEIVSLILKPRR